MLGKIENFIRDLLASLQTAKLYDTSHPIFRKSVEKAFASLEEALEGNEELAIGIVGEELAFEKEIFFDLSKFVKQAILYLKSRGIERMVFYLGVEQDELAQFIAFLAAPKDEAQGDPQELLSLRGVRNIAVGKVRTSEAGPGEREKKPTLQRIYDNSAEKVGQSVTNALNLEKLDHMALRFSLHNVMENLSTQYRELLKLTTVKQHNMETFTHLLNVAILSMYFTSKLGFAKEVVLDIGVAALFHDIGKLYISRKVVAKKETLTEAEFSQIKSHTVLGAELMLKYTDSLGILPVVVAFEHHLKYDLSGYPKLKYLHKPNLASMIVSICDVYDALSARRGYKADYPPDLIYRIMTKDRGKAFDPELTDRFFQIMGVWPIGSIVSLNDARIAVVTEQNESDIFSPKVEVIHPGDRKETIDLQAQQGAIKIDKFLNPWKEGKDYLHLIGSAPPKRA
jgi:putative nucleotidyltransferase with HDIG domain